MASDTEETFKNQSLNEGKGGEARRQREELGKRARLQCGGAPGTVGLRKRASRQFSLSSWSSKLYGLNLHL